MGALVWVWLSLCAPAWAEDDDELHENTVSGAKGPAAEAPVDVPVGPDDDKAGRAYSPLTYKTAEVLAIDLAFAERCRSAVELIYARRYKEAKTELDKLSVEYPTTGIGPSGIAVIYQALMFENFDFRYEKQYKLTHASALRQIADGQRTPGNEAIEFLLLAGMQGLDAIHKMRRAEYLPAIALGIDAVRSLGEVKRVAPNFVDPLMGDGMYMYWRTVIARTTPLLPDGPDEREAGKALMRQVEKEGVLFSPAATLALTYAYLEERDLRNALARTMYGREKYPNNVINNMTAGRVLSQMRRYDDAVRMYRDVLATAPDNQRSHYHLGVVYSRQAKSTEAETAFRTYIAFADPPAEAKGQAWYRLGLLYTRQQRTDDARAAFQQAVAVGKNEAARKALTKLQ